jgi:hypothetical protein
MGEPNYRYIEHVQLRGGPAPRLGCPVIQGDRVFVGNSKVRNERHHPQHGQVTALTQDFHPIREQAHVAAKLVDDQARDQCALFRF